MKQKDHDKIVQLLIEGHREQIKILLRADGKLIEELFTGVESLLGIKNNFGDIHTEYCSWDSWQAFKKGYLSQ